MSSSATHVVAVGPRSIDLVRGSVVGPGCSAQLTETELKLLRFLVSRAGESVSRDALYTSVWGYNANVHSRALDAAMRRLRKKLEPNPSEPRFLLTVHGSGYRFLLTRPPTRLRLTDSRAVQPAWREEIDEILTEVRSKLDRGDQDGLVSLGVMAVRTLRWNGPREQGRELAAELASTLLEPWEQAWIRAESLPLLRGVDFTAAAEIAGRLATAHGDPALKSRVSLLSARGAQRAERLEEAHRYAIEAGSKRLEMQAKTQLATTLPIARTSEIHALYLDALETSQLLMDEWEEGLITANYARFLQQVGAVDEAIRRFDRALQVFREWGDTPNVVMSHLNSGVLENQRLRIDEARLHFRLGQEEATKIGARDFWVYCRLNELACCDDFGELDISELEALLKESRLASHTPQEAATLTMLGLAWQARGQAALARAPMDKAVRLAEEMGDPVTVAEYRGNLALLLLDLDEAAGIELLRHSIVALMDSKDHDADLSRLLLRWHDLAEKPEVPGFERRLLELARALPAPPGSRWERLAHFDAGV